MYCICCCHQLSCAYVRRTYYIIIMHVSPAPVQTIIVGIICAHYVNYDNIIVDPMIVVLANITGIHYS